MDDCISRQDALNDEYHGMIPEDVMKIYQNLNWLRDFLSSQPERKKGKWKPDDGNAFWVCSACGFASEAFSADILYNFCPSCGADMRGGTDG